MPSSLARHPFPVEAFFRRSLVLAYALPAEALREAIGPALVLDTYPDGSDRRGEELGFVAIALVETENLRPKGMPRWMGRSFFLSGYRIFTRFVRPGKPPLRGLKILRSDTDKWTMRALGNVFTQYGYRLADVKVEHRADEQKMRIRIKTPEKEADLDVDADLSRRPVTLPEGSPFPSLEDARHFAGPLPYTFSFDRATGKMVVVKGMRQAWSPRPVRVLVNEATFLDRPPFVGARLANAFYLEDVPYWWKAGTLESVEDAEGARAAP